MLKTTQNQLKTTHKKKLRDLQYAIYAKCYDCMGFMADDYHDCGMEDCSLYPYRLDRNVNRCSDSLASLLALQKAKIR